MLLAQITETTSDNVCMLIARQVVAYLRFLNLGASRPSIPVDTPTHSDQRGLQLSV